jgi:acyl-coenzyme A thioesterase PaaI-like protein
MSTKPSASDVPPGASLPQRSVHAPKFGDQIPSHYKSCFGCGEDHETGLHMLMFAGSDLSVEGTFTVTKHHQGARGLAHGGLLSAALDEVLGSLNWLLGDPAVTGRLECEFLKPVPVGSILHIHAEILGKERRKIYAVATARLNSVDGPIAVVAHAIFIQVGVEHFLKNGDRSDVKDAMSLAQDFEVNP